MTIKAAIFLAPGYEEIEALTPHDLLNRAGITVHLVSIENTLQVTSTHGATIQADKKITQINPDEYQILILPGGMPGTNNLAAHQQLKTILKNATQKPQKIAAICAAPTVLAQHGILTGYTATCYPGCETQLTENGATLSSETTVNDRNITTSQGPGTAAEFSLELIKQLCGAETAQKVANQYLYQ